MSIGYFGEAINLYTAQVSQEYASEIIEEVLKGDILEIMNEGSMMSQILNSEGDVVYSYLDTYKVNKIRNLAQTKIIEAIEDIEYQKGFQSVEIPLGYFFSKNMFLSDGIKVPINLDVVGSHNVDILVNATPYGINSSVVEIFLDVTINVAITIPFQEKAIVCHQTIPLSVEIINSDVPEYYFNGYPSVVGIK
ncbi:MAG: sporulation protein YunB [Anaeroplasmataceae bacterium]